MRKDPGPTGVQAGSKRAALRAVPTSLLTVREVAEQLGVSTATVYKLCERGALEHVRVLNAVRVTPAALVAFVAAGGSGARGDSQPISEKKAT